MAEIIDFTRRKKFLLQKKKDEAEAEIAPENEDAGEEEELPTPEERKQKSREARRKMHNMRVTKTQKLKKEE